MKNQVHDCTGGKDMIFTQTDITKILKNTELGHAKAKVVTKQIIQAMVDSLSAGKTIRFRGFGTMEPKERKAQNARNPRTGEIINVPAHRRVIFRPGQELKKALRKQLPVE